MAFTGQLSGIGKVLRLLRNRSGLTQTQAAERLGTQQPEISRWEKEEPMTLETLERLLTLYESDLEELGAMLKGHGGILDRADSYVFSGAICYYYIHWAVLQQGLAEDFMHWLSRLG